MKKIWEKVVAFIVANTMSKESEREMWEEERRLALMETEHLTKWEQTASALGKKLTRKQEIEERTNGS